MKKCIVILTICILSIAAAYADVDDIYYTDNSLNTDIYLKTNDGMYQSLNTGTLYKVDDNSIQGTDGSYYIRANDMIFDVQNNATYFNNNGYILEL